MLIILTRTVNYGGYTFNVPEYVIHRGKRYDFESSYTFDKLVAMRWARNVGSLKKEQIISMKHFVVEIVKSFKSEEKPQISLHILYKRYIDK